MSDDRLIEMFVQQDAFMRLLQERRTFPDYPVDITSKDGQRVIKEYSHECMHELFEAIHMLRNSKSHRATDVREFDRAKYIEELVDAMHYFVEICLLSGVTPDELHKAYIEKGETNTSRIVNGY